MSCDEKPGHAPGFSFSARTKDAWSLPGLWRPALRGSKPAARQNLFYPDHYNGAFVACPDPVDFHAFLTVDLYSRDNLFYLQGANKRIEQPAMRDYLGHTLLTIRDNIAYEAALGDHGRTYPRS